MTNDTVVKNISKCRICDNTGLIDVIHIYDQFLSPTFVKTNQDNPLSDIKVSQTITLCDGCGLVQMRETVNPDLLYKQYFYRTATNDTMKRDLQKVVKFAMANTSLNADDIVVDIGANDCTMIQWFPSSAKRFGVEPAENIDWSNVDKSVSIINDYFNRGALTKRIGQDKVKIFTSCAMFYDIDDPNTFVKTIKDTLDVNGVFIIQLSYIVSMIKNINFYDICNEHLSYYSLETLNNLMNLHDLEIYDAIENNVNGGSALVAITHKGQRDKTARYKDLLRIEKGFNLHDPETFKNFYGKVMEIKSKVSSYIKRITDSNNQVIGLGASTKGNMLLQLFDLDKSIISCISERNKDKVGLRTLGTDIPLISEEEARERNPSCMLVLPWYFKAEIVARELDYINSGGELLFPMPYPHVVRKDGEEIL
jgi:hypothetical protein